MAGETLARDTAYIRCMRIAQIAPPWFPVPPTGYGGIELMVALLSDGLVERGHQVTLFASGGSSSKATVSSPLDEPPDPAILGDVWSDTFHALSSYLAIRHGDFDVVHDHSGIIGPAMASIRPSGPPVVHTLHGPWTEAGRRMYGLIDSYVQLVAIAGTQRADNPAVRYARTIHNGIDTSTYEYREKKDDYLVYIGRANPDKGPATAIEVAKRVGLPLKMIVKRNEPPERLYWAENVVPLLDHSIEVFENVPHADKVELLAGARAMVFPIQWAEPFGLVMVEAMACGTPVVAGRWGAAVEVVSHGETGYLADGIEELLDAIGKVDSIDPAACRDRVERMFSKDTMVSAYEELFRELVPG